MTRGVAPAFGVCGALLGVVVVPGDGSDGFVGVFGDGGAVVGVGVAGVPGAGVGVVGVVVVVG
jgi:hypothetical protein